jgi:hypothetical protein
MYGVSEEEISDLGVTPWNNFTKVICDRALDNAT